MLTGFDRPPQPARLAPRTLLFRGNGVAARYLRTRLGQSLSRYLPSFDNRLSRDFPGIFGSFRRTRACPQHLSIAQKLKEARALLDNRQKDAIRYCQPTIQALCLLRLLWPVIIRLFFEFFLDQFPDTFQYTIGYLNRLAGIFFKIRHIRRDFW